MPDEDVGSVARLWRYPVKSMLGEELESARVVWSGFYGNRSYALVDAETSMLVSAKNPRKWGRIFECKSALLGGDGGGDPRGPARQPPVRVSLPDGSNYDIADGAYGESESAFTQLFGRRVRFIAAREEPKVAVVEEYHAEIEEEERRGEVTEFVRPASSQAGTFTDMAAVHLVTTSTLRALGDLQPDSDFDVLRFRPNMLVDTQGAQGFIERSWVGRTLAVGGGVELKVFAECGRCVMTTLGQKSIPPDPGVLSAVKRHNRGKVGVFASVVSGGRVMKDDRVALK